VLANRLRELRNSHGMSATQLATRSGVSKSFISQLESGRTSASIATLGRIADALGVSTGHLLSPSRSEVAPHAPGTPACLLFSREKSLATPGLNMLGTAQVSVHAVAVIPPGDVARGHAEAGSSLVVTCLRGSVQLSESGDAPPLTVSEGDVASLQRAGDYSVVNSGPITAFLLISAPSLG
jgi:transcriptional regulator with XRE-family HTH domain